MIEIDAERLRRTFLELLAFDSPNGEEKPVAVYCAEALRDAGFVCQLDAAGNVVAQKSGAVTAAPRLFFSAHTDTVQPTTGLVVREEDGVFRTSGDTILGADDKAGLAEILEAMRALDDADAEHGDLQVILTTGEEVGLLGAKALSPAVIAGSVGFVLDASGATGSIITAAPTHDNLEVTVRGRASHAGFAPEQGVSALQIACRAVDRMRLGRIDPETTANLGTLHGGVAGNVVPEEASLWLEARSRDPRVLREQVTHMRECLEEAARHYGGQVEILIHRDYDGYAFQQNDAPLRLAAAGWREATGTEPRYRATGGGSDANVFNAIGVPTVVLSCGYVEAHSVREHIARADLEAGARWVAGIVLAATVGV
jgi:tripeptide aminopeptidase